ncbi:MAG: DUF1475 family protein [Gammaproteobacteria bacterium]
MATGADPGATGSTAARAGERLGVGIMIVMGLALTYGFVEGDLDRFLAFAAVPWGTVTLIDLYAAFSVIGAWAVARAGGAISGWLWLLGFFCGGSFVIGLYLFLAGRADRRGEREFWSGRPIRPDGAVTARWTG